MWSFGLTVDNFERPIALTECLFYTSMAKIVPLSLSAFWRWRLAFLFQMGEDDRYSQVHSEIFHSEALLVWNWLRPRVLSAPDWVATDLPLTYSFGRGTRGTQGPHGKRCVAGTVFSGARQVTNSRWIHSVLKKYPVSLAESWAELGYA